MAIQHSVLTDPELHEPKGAAGASAGTVYVANGAGSGSWTASVNVDATSDDVPYARLNGAWAPVAMNPVDSYWSADTTGIAAPPASGNIIWNNATQASATHLFISADNSYGVTKRPEMLNYIQSYDTLSIYEAGNPNTFQRWKITNAADGTSYIDYTVELIASNGGNIADTTDLVITFQANLADAKIQTILDGLATATVNQIWACDGAGSGAFYDITEISGANHSIAYIVGNSQAVTVTTGGTFYQVKHASITWTEDDSDGNLAWNDTDKTIDVAADGHYIVHFTGSWTGNTTNDVIELGLNVGATVDSANVLNKGRPKLQLPGSGIRTHYNVAGTFYFEAVTGDKLCPMVTTTTSAGTVTIVDLNMIAELVHI